MLCSPHFYFAGAGSLGGDGSTGAVGGAWPDGLVGTGLGFVTPAGIAVALPSSLFSMAWASVSLGVSRTASASSRFAASLAPMIKYW